MSDAALAERISQDSAAYGYWLTRALANPPSVDKFFWAHRDGILRIAAAFRKNWGVPTAPVHRGILVEDRYVRAGTLIADPKVPFLSFSEDLSVAHNFADIESDMALILRMHTKPGELTGYTMKHDPAPSEILFWWRWLEPIGLLAKLGQGNQDLIREQKEVMVIQTGIAFPLTRYVKGAP